MFFFLLFSFPFFLDLFSLFLFYFLLFHCFLTSLSSLTSLTSQSSPTRSSWTRRRSSPTESLLGTPTTMTLHSKICSIKYIERKPITLYEKTCLSVCCRRQCPIEQGDLLEIDRGDSVSTEAQKHRLGLCSMIKKSKFLQKVKQELIDTNFKQLESKKSNNFFKDNYGSKSWNFVKLINEVLQRWKNYGSFRVLHSTLWRGTVAASPGAARRSRLWSRRSHGPWAHNLWRGRTRQ